jgi:phosphoglycolate phosphatase-like HAD superfamily hydrolase
MTRFAFDLDNTLIDCIYSDFEIYSQSCVAIGVKPLAYDVYSDLRRSGRMDLIMDELDLKKRSDFYSVRSLLSKNESIMFLDRAILDINVLRTLMQKSAFAIVSSRDSSDILEEQIDRLGWRDVFKCYCVPRASDAAVVDAKAACLSDFMADFYVGDKKTDLLAAQKAGVVPVLVKTGFWKVEPLGDWVFENVNEFLQSSSFN